MEQLVRIVPTWCWWLAALLIGVCSGGWGAWVWQDNAYGKQLAEKDRAHGREREEVAAAALNQLAEQQDARRALEARLKGQTKTHWKEMKDAQKTQDRLRDRLATADLRLSVLIDAGSIATQSCDSGMRETAGARGVVHGAVRAYLDPAHAQRIVGITDEGDRGLIALRACQTYVREVTMK